MSQPAPAMLTSRRWLDFGRSDAALCPLAAALCPLTAALCPLTIG